MTPAREEVRSSAAERQRRASDPAASAWVSANAGSGKTRVLIDRVARLLLAGAEPSRILCITYTKAAAAEMSSRLFKRLGEWSMAGDEALIKDLAELGESLEPERLGEARRLFARALETPGGLKIETIHAFCQRILQRFPVEAGVAPEFDVIDEQGAEALLLESRQHVFRGMDEGPDADLADAIGTLLEGEGESNFAAILKDGISARTKIERFLGAAEECKGIAPAIRSALGLGANETAEAIERACLSDIAGVEDDLRRLAQALEAGTSTEAASGRKISDFLASENRSETFAGYREVFFTGKGEPRKRIANKATLDQHAGLGDIIAREANRLEGWERRQRSVRIADATIAALEILRHIFKHYAALKRLRCALDYDDLVARTRELLKSSTNAWVHYKLDGGIDHVLIDEAQDTSPDQWEIIRHLTGEFFTLEKDDAARQRTIFAVGDQKQSIYSFQGADPRGFKRLSDHLGEVVMRSGRAWSPTELEVSFRSVSEVLVAVDAAFDNEAMRGALTAEAADVSHEAERIGHRGLVELWPKLEKPKNGVSEHEDWTRPVDERPGSAPETQLANTVAKKIRAWINAATPLSHEGEGASRAIDAGDVLILVRQRGALFYEMLRALNRERLPVAGSDRMVLREETAYLDLDALGRFCLLPSDDLALAEVLKGPFIGLGEDELFALAQGREGSLWNALGSASEPRAANARTWLEEALASSRTLRPFEFYQRVLCDPVPGASMSAHMSFAMRLGLDAGDVIGEFLRLALDYEREGPATLQGFLNFAAEHANTIKRDMEKSEGRIRVMTVHGAKGLEAPIVFLIDTCSVPQPPKGKWLIGEGETADQLVPLLRPRKEERDGVTDALARVEEERQRGEYQRQLYVAMTRAQDRLYVAGIKSRCYEGSWHDTLSATLASLEEAREIEPNGKSGWRLGEETQGEAERRRPSVRTHAEPDWLRRPVPRERGPLRRTPSGLLEEEERALPPVLAPFTSARDPFLRGRAIHKLLQLLPDMPAAERAGAAERILRMPAYRALAPDASEITAEALRLLEGGAFARVFGSGSRAEVPISGVLETASGTQLIVSGQIDRLLVTENEILIVDFKTNRPAPASADEVPRAYVMQIAAYARLLCEALPHRTVKAALIYTSIPRFITLDLAGIDVTQITSNGPSPQGPAGLP